MFGLQGRHREALHQAKRGLDLFRAAEQPAGVARALNDVGWAYAELGEYQQALTYCEQALALHREIGDLDGQAETSDAPGYAHHHLGQYQQAITCYRSAFELFQGLGDRYQAGGALAHLGDTQQCAGDANAARVAWQHALTLLDQVGHPDADTVRAKLDAAPVIEAVP